jgi:glyoxylase-like metal-dependent hydrolase (beta-lactamase superfamily II)
MRTTALPGGFTAIQDAMEIPGLGVLPVNAFLLMAQQPVLVDTGLPLSRPDFVAALGQLVDLQDLRWIWLSHPDRDHTGSLYELLELAPQATVVTTFAGLGISSIDRPLPMDRVYLLNPGQQLDVGDRTLTCFRPPLFDSPATTGFVDDSTGTVFASDCFGAPMATHDLALADDVAATAASDLEQAQRLWASVDAPWVAVADPAVFAAGLEPLRALQPDLLLSSHLPPAAGRAEEFLDRLATLPGIPAFVGPDQAVLSAMLADLEPAPA